MLTELRDLPNGTAAGSYCTVYDFSTPLIRIYLLGKSWHVLSSLNFTRSIQRHILQWSDVVYMLLMIAHYLEPDVTSAVRSLVSDGLVIVSPPDYWAQDACCWLRLGFRLRSSRSMSMSIPFSADQVQSVSIELIL